MENLNIKGHLINFKNYMRMAEEFSKRGMKGRAEEMLVSCDVARDSIYRVNQAYPDLAAMSKEISAARKRLL